MRGAVLGAQVRCPKYVAPSTAANKYQQILSNINKYYHILSFTIIVHCHTCHTCHTCHCYLAAFVGCFRCGQVRCGLSLAVTWLLLGLCYLVSVTWQVRWGKLQRSTFEWLFTFSIPFPLAKKFILYIQELFQ